MRQRSALEGAFAVRLILPWIGTLWQPADEGTRPNADGCLPLPKPLKMCAWLMLEIFAGTARVTSAMNQIGVRCEAWDIVFGVKFDLLIGKNARRLLSLVRSGHVRAV